MAPPVAQRKWRLAQRATPSERRAVSHATWRAGVPSLGVADPQNGGVAPGLGANTAADCMYHKAPSHLAVRRTSLSGSVTDTTGLP